MNTSQLINKHYASASLLARIQQALITAGLSLDKLTLDDLAPLDQLHIGGRLASRQLATKVDLQAGAKLLDIGCGTGGASRLLASEYKLQVVGVDLTQAFIEAAEWLTAATNLTANAEFICADAQSLPLAAASFDYVWCQHTLLNLPNLDQGLAEAFRVLKPNGKLLLHEVVSGTNQEEVIYPVPWASDASTNHLMSLEALQSSLSKAGFVLQQEEDITAEATSWRKKYTQREATQATAQAKPQITQQKPATKLTTEVIFGARFLAMGKNLMTNLAADKLRLIQAVWQKPA